MNQIKYLNNSKIEEKDNEKYIIKKRKTDIDRIYSQLKNRTFNNYLNPIEINSSHEIYPFIHEPATTDGDRAIDIIYLASILHNKSTIYERQNIDELKKIYEDTINELNKIYNYYNNIQDEIEEHIYMSPAELLLINNISKIYLMINISRRNIEKYFKDSEEDNSIRKSIIHGNLSLNHILESEDKHLISWNKSHIDIPIKDIVIFYKNDYDQIDIKSLYYEYQKRYQLNQKEKYLFLSMINIPWIVEFSKDNFINTIKVRKLVDYLNKTIEFSLKENEKYEETNQ